MVSLQVAVCGDGFLRSVRAQGESLRLSRIPLICVDTAFLFVLVLLVVTLCASCLRSCRRIGPRLGHD